MTVLSIDCETGSRADLKKVGAIAYAQHPSTHVICMAWAFDNEEPECWSYGATFPQRVLDHIENDGEVHAWNAPFEYWIWNCADWGFQRKPLTSTQLHCSMTQASYWGLPLSLDAAAKAAGVIEQKDMQGHRAMLRMSRPRSLDFDDGPVWWHEHDFTRLEGLMEYCKNDVRAERAVSRTLPKLPPDERATWLLDQRMNAQGFMLDRKFVDRLAQLTEAELIRLNADMNLATGGAAQSASALPRIKEWLADQGLMVASLSKETLAALLDNPQPHVPQPVLDVLSIRRAAKTSTAKLQAMVNAQNVDGRVRGLVQHYGANRTGRWAGRLVQVQNLPRPPKDMNVKQAVEHILMGFDAETLRTIHGPLLTVVSACLRSCFVAAPGRELVVADFRQIEARVLAWLARDTELLAIFAADLDVYTWTANAIGSDNRQLGKVLALACGYGMGPDKFYDTARKDGLKLSLSDAVDAVHRWRMKRSRIVAYWRSTEAVVRTVLRQRIDDRWIGAGRVSFRMARNKMKGALLAQLPSQRLLVYRNCRLGVYQDQNDAIVYDGVNQKTRQYQTLYTYGGKLVENLTQAIARDVMEHAMRAVMDGLPRLDLITTIHDEIIGEADVNHAKQALADMKEIMRRPPAWADADLPLDAEGYVGPRYLKG
jgi:DNA polymerase